MIDKRVPGHGHDVEAMRKRRILIDGSPETGEGLLLQIFTENMVGPIFFEIIQRKGNEGFGEGNFKALFESIELDQIKRGVIPAHDRPSLRDGMTRGDPTNVGLARRPEPANLTLQQGPSWPFRDSETPSPCQQEQI